MLLTKKDAPIFMEVGEPSIHTDCEDLYIVHKVIRSTDLQDCIDHASFGYVFLVEYYNQLTGEHTKEVCALSEMKEKYSWFEY